ncbi:MAG: luciferase family protein [Verrucomicrobiota bacterium]
MFYFVVRYARWLARVPGLPQFFDALLFLSTWIFKRSRVEAMEALENEALRLPNVRLKNHRFGGTEFVREPQGELGHIHGQGLLDVLLTREASQKLLATGRVRPHHVFPDSRWISFQIKSMDDIPFAIELLQMAIARA